MNAVPLKLLLPQRIGIDDDQEGPLVIDEQKLKKSPAKVRQAQQRSPIKIRLSGKQFYSLVIPIAITDLLGSW